MSLLAYILPAFFVLLYVLFMHRTRKAWQRIETFATEKNYQPLHFVSVLIPFRNELNNLPSLIKDLTAQDFPKVKCEFIFINDHSDDGSEKILETLLHQFRHAQLISLKDKTGKKAALQTGLEVSKGEVIVTVDADVRLKNHWLTTITAFHHLQEPALSILPVSMQEERTYWKQLIRLEWMSLMALTGGSAERHKALMCNGANLAMERAAFLHIGGFTSYQHISSGDDMFTLINMKKLGPNSVKYLWNHEAIAQVKAPSTFFTYISQRIRWASKTSKAKDIHILSAGLILLFGNLAMMSSVALSFYIAQHWLLTLFLFGIKLTVEFSLLQATAKKFEEKILERDAMLLSIIYPVYMLIIPLIGLFYRPKWKGRTIQA
ncbi:MAG: glycosyltransferase [Flavobacteriales bacterium]